MEENVRSLAQNLSLRFRVYFKKAGLAAIPIETEWRAFDEKEIIKRYSPRVDLAIGPFSCTGGKSLAEEYQDYYEISRGLIDKFGFWHERNCDTHNLELPKPHAIEGRNARCFLAIEIERSGSRKHRLGDILNAAALGCMGIIIAWDESIARSFMRILKYFNFLSEVRKSNINADNLFVVTREQALSVFKANEQEWVRA
jgi:hypothetical protein